eukprot:gnl/TRDRNA2_/TRDRNA2_87067_c0_seq2.p1 gnl/TRDRNA2_/TRDRNA2_87067_c0~~gnl/TRDRNA2_/TRDRNA2_87067_c0_seq2.p1  ORF type:complete len:382 (-),score=64.75 gnl/TRDRNA2_/TRDRNA2_87067_c0_seq2:276-1421(-)
MRRRVPELVSSKLFFALAEVLVVEGFKYVLVPASPNEPMQEFEWAEVVTLEDDSWRNSLEKYFATNNNLVDRAVLLAQLKERSGTDLEAKMNKTQIDGIINSGSVEIFSVLAPQKEYGYLGVSAYLDDKGVSKNLEVNSRATSMLAACGHRIADMHGDVFFSRYFDDEEKWERLDFTLADCSSEAAWARRVQEIQGRKNVGDLDRFREKIGMAKDTPRVSSEIEDEDRPKGETQTYRWRQTKEEVEITFKKEGLQKSDAKVVKVDFKRSHVTVNVKGESLLHGSLACAIDPISSTWTLSDGVLQVTMAKAIEEEWWDDLLAEPPKLMPKRGREEVERSRSLAERLFPGLLVSISFALAVLRRTRSKQHGLEPLLHSQDTAA